MESEGLFPLTDNSPVVRTDFDDESAWKAVCDLIRQPVNFKGDAFYAHVDFIENPIFRDRTVTELLNMIPSEDPHTFLLIVDRATINGPEFPILVLDLRHERGRTFRVIPSEIQGVENNLSIANMDFYEFADNVDEDGVFRGFKGM